MTLAPGDAGLELDETEELVLVHDRATGLGAAVAVDDTTLGPAIGGVRWLLYPDEQAAITEARRLARVMTLKSATAGIPSGGAKAVVFRPSPTTDPVARRALMEAFGRVVKRLEGRYVPGLDMGTALADLEVMGTQAPGICVMEPSEQTAVGVVAGIIAAAEVRWGRGIAGRSVLIQGAGHVGVGLATRLASAGAAVLVADVESARAKQLASEVGGTVVEPDDVLTHPCDVFAPCAIGRLADPVTVGAMRCEVIAGAANDVLSHRQAADALAARGIDYVPDFLINSGGVIAIHARRAGWDVRQLDEAVAAIGTRVSQVLRESLASGRTPLVIAEALASERLGHPVAVPR
ncbi:MAG: Glu/Leu/Phe/Val dehydrogenase dimerization domain-containing protein [Acidimicrobiales bacterium]